MSQRGLTEEDRVLAAEYVLGLLEPRDARALERRMRRNAALRAEVIAWQEHGATLVEALPEIAPSPHVYGAIRARLFPDDAPRGIGWLWPAGLAAVVGAALALVIALDLWPGPGTGTAAPALVADISNPAGGLVFAMTHSRETRSITLTRIGPAPADGRDYELWLIEDEGAVPVSMGVLPPGGTAVVPWPDNVPGIAPGLILAVSDEMAGGSVTGTPGVVLALGAISES